MFRLYNTLTRSKQEFVSIKKGVAKIYSCGPTVYSYQHIGNLRAAIFVDILKRSLRYCGYNVIDVVNITDVGHLVSDGDDGEDKMLKASKKENKDPYEIARYYEDVYVKDLEKLNIIKPKYMPRATDHIKEQLQIISDLEDKGYTYSTSDGVYFDVSKFKDYGILSRQNLGDKISGVRVKNDSEKRNPQDFALWKFLTGDNKNHIMKWDSKWGAGFPGWHLECSAMSSKYLGKEFDIHTGGIDHIPIHHENEIAQNVCSGSVNKINYWVHNDFMKVNGEKMAKSLGNVYTLYDLENKGYNGLVFRELCLRTHYRKTINFTFESLDAATKNVKSINEFYSRLNNLVSNNSNISVSGEIYNKYLTKFEDAIKDDLNTPVALSALHEFMAEYNKQETLSKKDIELGIKFVEEVDKVLGLLDKKYEIPKEVLGLAQERKIARENKDWVKSDNLRDKIRDLGYEIKDSKESKLSYIIEKL